MQKENNQLTSSCSVGMRDINDLLQFAPISRIKTLRDDEGRRGFTLIELLVVVLIIGILAAIALPQYQKAVEKARVSEAVMVLNSFTRACQLHELEGNEYCAGFDFNKGDISVLPGTPTQENCYDEWCINTKDWQYVDFTGNDYGAVRLINGNWENPPYYLYIHLPWLGDEVEPIYCHNRNDSSACQKICGANGCIVK